MKELPEGFSRIVKELQSGPTPEQVRARQVGLSFSPTRAERATLADDPYGYCIAHFSLRTLDRDLRTVTFKFDDGSELTFNIRYEVAT